MHFRRLHLALAVLLVTAPAVSAQVKKTAPPWTEWEMISPEGEEFTVSMPRNPTTESTTFLYFKRELSVRLYLAQSSTGPVLAIASLSGIKSDPAAYSDAERFNAYMDAFKRFFPPKVGTKEAITKLTYVKNSPLNGHAGRLYKLTIGDLTGSVHGFATRKRFYAIVSLNTKDEALEAQFVSSFVLPERQVEPPKVNVSATAEPAVDGEKVSGQKPDRPGSNSNQAAVTEANKDPNTANAATNQQPQKTGPQNTSGQQGEKRPIAGGMLNAKALYLPPPEVSASEASGVVLVAVVVDEQGSVIEARAVSGPQTLHAAAVNAARFARFSPTTLKGEPVKVSGTLSYNFGKSN